MTASSKGVTKMLPAGTLKDRRGRIQEGAPFNCHMSMEKSRPPRCLSRWRENDKASLRRASMLIQDLDRVFSGLGPQIRRTPQRRVFFSSFLESRLETGHSKKRRLQIQGSLKDLHVTTI